MKYLVEFKSWEGDNILNEQVASGHNYGFKASEEDASGSYKSGFAGLK